MEIYSYICTRTHYIRDEFSVSCIYDAKHNLYYFLKGISSNLWDLIIKYQDYNKLELFAKENNLNNELNALLFELREKEIIKIDKQLEKSNYDYLKTIISRRAEHIYDFLDKWRMMDISLGFIDTLILELNYKCNLKCKHCFNHKNMENYYISFEDAKKAIDQAYDMGISTVRLTGGECTLNKDFLKICEYIRSRRLELCIYTNGQTLNDNEELFEKVINLYPTLIQCSIYSMDPNVHDYITRVKGSWQKTINLINKLKNTSTLIDIGTPVLSYNKDSYKEIKEFADSIGATYLDSCLFTHNPENNNLESKLSYNDIKQFYIHKFNKLKVKPYFQKDERSICEAGYDRFCINPKLDILPCVAVDYVLGNLNSTTLKEMQETTLKDFKKLFIRKNLTECFDEQYCNYCHYCPDSSIFNNTFMKKQPILCENAKALYDALVCPSNKEE